MNTGCLKIFKKAAQFDEYNTFIPPHRRGEDIQLFRGNDDDDNDNDDDDDDDDDEQVHELRGAVHDAALRQRGGHGQGSARLSHVRHLLQCFRPQVKQTSAS